VNIFLGHPMTTLRAHVNTVINYPDPYKEGNSLISWVTITFSRRTTAGYICLWKRRLKIRIFVSLYPSYTLEDVRNTFLFVHPLRLLQIEHAAHVFWNIKVKLNRTPLSRSMVHRDRGLILRLFNDAVSTEAVI
jgi:hypothetical protein